jgi:L-threonylcarbamoyladenylate synthase
MNSADNDIDLLKAIRTLKEGGIILYPTDTVWGIGCIATDPSAIGRIYRIKQRDDSKALITLMADTRMLETYIDDIPQQAIRMVEETASPLTVIYNNVHGVASNLTAADGSIAVRISHNDFCRQLCLGVDAPIVSTSANISGQPTPRTFAEIPEYIKDTVDYVCLTGRSDDQPHKPSSIVRITADGTVETLRK